MQLTCLVVLLHLIHVSPPSSALAAVWVPMPACSRAVQVHDERRIPQRRGNATTAVLVALRMRAQLAQR